MEPDWQSSLEAHPLSHRQSVPVARTPIKPRRHTTVMNRGRFIARVSSNGHKRVWCGWKVERLNFQPPSPAVCAPFPLLLNWLNIHFAKTHTGLITQSINLSNSSFNRWGVLRLRSEKLVSRKNTFDASLFAEVPTWTFSYSCRPTQRTCRTCKL